MVVHRKIFPLLLIALAGCAGAQQRGGDAAICDAFSHGDSRVEVEGTGTVTRVLGTKPGRSSPHEGFLARMDSHCPSVIVRFEVNTDFTGSIPLEDGATVGFKGEYEYTRLGGVIHWTHRSNGGSHPGGYIQAGGQMYQ